MRLWHIASPKLQGLKGIKIAYSRLLLQNFQAKYTKSTAVYNSLLCLINTLIFVISNVACIAFIKFWTLTEFGDHDVIWESICRKERMDSCKSLYDRWVDPETVNYVTAYLYLILLSDHNDNFSKYNTKIITDCSFKNKTEVNQGEPGF